MSVISKELLRGRGENVLYCLFDDCFDFTPSLSSSTLLEKHL